MPLLAWTAALAVYATAAIIVALVVPRVGIIRFTGGRTRLICDVIFALLGSTVLAFFFWF